MAEEFTENELATINEILKMQAGAAMTPEEMQPVQPQNFGTPPQQGALPTAPDMTTEQGKAAYLQQAIDNIKSRTTGRRETGSQKLANLATGALPKQAGSAMTPEEMQQLQMMRGQR
tara:strand:- start:380 stop:730 length:351 start_codon:yes stop_codon:yes gene_type:complete